MYKEGGLTCLLVKQFVQLLYTVFSLKKETDLSSLFAHAYAVMKGSLKDEL